jgi:hypothetical protein
MGKVEAPLIGAGEIPRDVTSRSKPEVANRAEHEVARFPLAGLRK